MFSRTSLLYALLAAVTMLLSACSGVKPLVAERPVDEAFRAGLRQVPSSLSVTLDATAAELDTVLNRSLRKELYKGSTKTKGLTVDLLRNGPIRTRMADNYIYFTLPITLTLSYGMFETVPIPLTLSFKASARISADWKLHAEIYYQGLSDLLAEETRIGPVSINPRSIVEGVTQPVQKLLSEQLSRKLNDMYPLKAEVAKVWNAVQKPLLLHKDYRAWLVLSPQEVMLSPLAARDNKLKVSVGIRTFAELVVGPEPASRPPVPLPNLKLVDAFDKTFRIALNSDLFFRDMMELAGPKIIDRQFGENGKTITVKKFELYGNGDRLVVRLETVGALDGVLYLTARPAFDPRQNRFSVEDLDFDLSSKSLLLQSADWLLHGTIRESIREKLNMDLGTRLEETRALASTALSRVPLADHVFLRGAVKSLQLSDVLVGKDKLSIQVVSDGEVSVYFQ